MGATILVVEDAEEIRQLIRVVLEQAEYAVIEAADGREGLRRAYAERPDAIILDVTMPELDGWSTVERLRAFSDTPVLFLTARAAETDMVRGLRAGADDYMTKPFSPLELLARIEAVLRRAKASTDKSETRDPVHDDGVTRIDFGRRSVEVRGEPVALTPLEFRLIAVFVQHPNQVLSRTQLAQLVWDDFSGGPTEQVRLYVSYLRRKLQAVGGDPLIGTVRGFGYSYEPAVLAER